MSFATDNAIPTSKPGRLNVKNIVIASGLLGLWLLVAGVIAHISGNMCSTTI